MRVHRVVRFATAAVVTVAGLATTAVPAQAGDTPSVLRFPGPRAVNLGTGWTIHDVLPSAENPQPKRSCRVATECTGVRWSYLDGQGRQLGLYGVRAYKGSPEFLRAELRNIRRESVSQGIKVVGTRTGKFRSFVFTGRFTSGPYVGQKARFVYTTYRWKRVATMGLQANPDFFDGRKRDFPLSTVLATTTSMAAPAAGPLSRTVVPFK